MGTTAYLRQYGEDEQPGVSPARRRHQSAADGRVSSETGPSFSNLPSSTWEIARQCPAPSLRVLLLNVEGADAPGIHEAIGLECLETKRKVLNCV